MKNTSLKRGVLALGFFIASSGAGCMAKPTHQAFAEFAQELRASGNAEAAKLPELLAEGLSQDKSKRMGFFALKGIALVAPAKNHLDYILSKANASGSLDNNHKDLLARLGACLKSMNAIEAAQLIQNA